MSSSSNKDIKSSYITGDFEIIDKYVNKYIQIINSFENLTQNDEYNKNYSNAKDILDNIDLIIDEKEINFSYDYKFKKAGIYTIKYLIKNDLTNINYMFSGCKFLTALDLSNFYTEKVINMRGMLYDCKSLKELNLLKLNTKNVTDMSFMFSGCESLENLNLSNFNTDKVNNMKAMFDRCISLKELNLSNLNTKNVTDMSWMFYACSSLKELV